MAIVTIFGKGSMGEAIASNFVDAGNEVKFVASSESDKVNSIGEIVVLAVPYPAVEGILATYADELDGSGLAVIDAGSLKRARELEALGFLQISLTAAEKISCGDDIRFCNFNFLASKYEEKE